MVKQKKTFEELLAELEAIVTAIEDGEVPLEESIEKYAEGIKLVKQGRAILDQAEKKIQVLAKGADGDLTGDGELDAEDDSA